MSKNDGAIKTLLAAVEDQKSKLGSKGRSTLTTNGIFKRDSSNFFNINTVSDVTVLAGALGFLIAQEQAFEEGCQRLGLKETFKWDGYTVDEWEEDFAMRVKSLEYDKKKKALDSTKAKLSSLVSEEARTEMELEEIKKALGV